jgi:DNA invertase Pin-like site-specific DNA recombinase
MKDNSRIRFNPATKEIEVEGSESFVKSYFNKLQAMISGPSEVIAEKSIAARVRSSKKAARKKPGEKKVTNIDTVVTLIHGSAEGISTAELKKKTGLAEQQIWNIVNRATKERKIRKMKRGLYGPRE